MLLRYHGLSFLVIPRRHFQSRPPGPLVDLVIFPLLRCSLTIWYVGCVVDVSAGTEHPMICCFLHFDHLCLSVCDVCEKKLLWYGVRGALLCGKDEDGFK